MRPRRVPGALGGAGSPPVVRFTFDGRQVEGIEGEPLAASLLAAGHQTLSRSFRFHRPRGLMCSTGSCGWCECEVDGVPSVRSCRAPVREGLVVRGEHALPSVERDLLALVGLGSRWIPPTFYHHRFLRPRRLRKRYLDVLRWFGGRGRLRVEGRGPAPAGRALTRLEPDVLVVGGGRAGLLAALGAAEAGARVVLIEAEASIGGGWRVDGPDQALGRIGALAEAVAAAGVEILVDTTAVGWYDGVIAAIGTAGHLEIRARAVIAATGSYERVPLVPGADRPGVMAARTMTGLIQRFGIVPGGRVLLVGEGEEVASAAVTLAGAGASVVGPVPTASLVSVRGRNRVTGAVTREGARNRLHRIDVVAFAGRSPNLDLALAAEATVERRGDVLVTIADEAGRTSVPSLFVAGSAAGRPVVGAAEAVRARATGRAAAGAAPEGSPPAAAPPVVRTGPTRTGHVHPASAAGGAMVCFCEDVRVWEIRAEYIAGYDDPELLKRRTGALTGPCQGKYCLQSFACLVAADTMPTARPPLRPVRLGDLVATDPADGSPR